uniref:Uncharacterized protein n=1 Tax=Panagrolaimus davidi TaxID=227884 RepID=A0A914QZQ9_9BILA
MLWAKILLIVACLAAMALTQDDQQFYDETSDSNVAPRFDDPSSLGSSNSLSNPLGVIGVVTLWPKGSQQEIRQGFYLF